MKIVFESETKTLKGLTVYDVDMPLPRVGDLIELPEHPERLKVTSVIFRMSGSVLVMVE